MNANVLTLIKEKLEKDLEKLQKEQQTLKEQGLFSKSDVVLGMETEIRELQEYIETLEATYSTIETPIGIDEFKKYKEAELYFKSNGKYGKDPIKNGLIDENRVYEETKKLYIREKEHQNLKGIIFSLLLLLLCAVCRTPDYIICIFAAGSIFLMVSSYFKNYDLQFDKLYKEETKASSVCALREFEAEKTCKKECEFYKGNGTCSEEYDISFCPYQCKKGTTINIKKL